MNDNNLINSTKDIILKKQILNDLIKLGFNISIKGTRIYLDLIIFYLNEYSLNFDYNFSLTSTYSQKFKSIYKTKSNVQYTFSTINTNFFKENFNKIFNINFDYVYLSPKNLLVLFLNKYSSLY